MPMSVQCSLSVSILRYKFLFHHQACHISCPHNRLVVISLQMPAEDVIVTEAAYYDGICMYFYWALSAKWLGYGLRRGGTGVRLQARKNIFFHYRAQVGSGTHTTSYKTGTGDSSSGGKAARAWRRPFISAEKADINVSYYTSDHPYAFMACCLFNCRNSILTYLLTSWSRVLLEKLTGFQLVKKFAAFYGTRKFITAFASARHLSLSWASSIQSITPHPTSWRSILIFLLN